MAPERKVPLCFRVLAQYSIPTGYLFVRAFLSEENQRFCKPEVPSCSTLNERAKIAILGGRGSNKEAADETCIIMGHPRKSGVTTGYGKKKGRIRN
jgi:hypothetical protein